MNDTRLSVVVLTVPRPSGYFEKTAAMLDAQGISFMVSVGEVPEEKKYEGRRISIPRQAYEPNYMEQGIRYRVHCNYINALTAKDSDVAEDYRLILEDDVRLCNNFLDWLSCHLKLLQQMGEGYILSLYNPFKHESMEQPALCMGEIDIFFGTQAMLYPSHMLQPLADYIKKNILELPYDFLVKEFCKKNDYKICHTTYSLVQHVGENTTGLGAFHQSPNFIDYYKCKEV